ncbi:ATP-binding protein [Kordia algicida OT-1]|uniref:histidine kinase n=1 Tax=Kordia algicida OT-1 TaxID=391587 RepID=A9E3I0_9FLAO|nr:ATP-binding protein [Kordia algicida]EDP95513.1 response regulator receiver domain protein (CheY-like) [Kordia algicida OT-1]
MVFNRFQLQIIIYLIGICLSFTTALYLIIVIGNFPAVFGGILASIVGAILFRYLYLFIAKTNRKLQRFIDSIKYSDFVLKFSSDDKLDQNFKGLNNSFNAILEAFRKERASKEENLQYLKTILQQVNTGLMVVHSDGSVVLVNDRAKKIISLRRIKHIDELKSVDERLYKILSSFSVNTNYLLDFLDNTQLIIRSTSLKIKSKTVRIFTFQNIYSELQQKEIESWQNLIKILRHEIMNSITPISSLNATLRDILDKDLMLDADNFILPEESVEDLKEGLSTIENRTDGLIKFIDSYRAYSNLPKPNFEQLNLKELVQKTCQLLDPEVSKAGIAFSQSFSAEAIKIKGDANLLEMVLINLVKNAIQANEGVENARIEITVGKDTKRNPFIAVKDNGKGIVPEAVDKIFMPFFTTKKVGTGIGLSLSKQIMQLHHGTLSVKSEEGEQTIFTLKFLQTT